MKNLLILSTFLMLILLPLSAFGNVSAQPDTLKNKNGISKLQGDLSDEQHPDLIGVSPYKKHFSINFNIGYWQQAKSTQVSFDQFTLVNVSDYHFKMGAQFEYNFTEALSVYLDVNAINIPREEKLDGITFGNGNGISLKASGKGGIIIPYGIGVRYAWTGKPLRPFVTSSVGATYLYLGGGSVSIGFIADIEENITERKKQVFQYNFGGGLDYRFSQWISFRLAANYFLSSPISPPLGSIKAFQGLSLNLGMVLIPGRYR